jgi:hypothetical protein
MYAASGVDTSSTACATTAVLATPTIVGFTIATWGPFRRTRWWEPLAVLSAIVGLASQMPHWIAADTAGGANPPFDVAIHAIGCASVLLLLQVPRFEHWMHGHVVADR